MIELKVDGYCNNCSSFEADVNVVTYASETHTTIKCCRRENCKAIKKYLETVSVEEGEVK